MYLLWKASISFLSGFVFHGLDKQVVLVNKETFDAKELKQKRKSYISFFFFFLFVKHCLRFPRRP